MWGSVSLKQSPNAQLSRVFILKQVTSYPFMCSGSFNLDKQNQRLTDMITHENPDVHDRSKVLEHLLPLPLPLPDF